MLSNLKPIGFCLGLSCSIASVVAQDKITTTLAGGNGMTSYNCGNFFDLEVLNPKGLKITQFEVSTRVPANTRFFVEVYLTNDTYVGKDTNEDLWTRVVDGEGVSAGPDAGTLSALKRRDVTPSSFFLAPGKYGMYVLFRTGGTHYTDGTGTGPSGNQVVSNKDIALTFGIARSDRFGGSPFSPRVWNGAITYAADTVGGSGYFGHGCRGSTNRIPGVGLPGTGSESEPKIGSSTKILLFDMVDSSSGYLFLGVTKQEVDLTPIGMANCALNLQVLRTFRFQNVNGIGDLPASIPNEPTLVGTLFHIQSAVPDKSANTFGLTASPGLSIRIGK